MFTPGKSSTLNQSDKIKITVQIEGPRYDSDDLINDFKFTISLHATVSDLKKEIIKQAGMVNFSEFDWLLSTANDDATLLSLQDHDQNEIKNNSLIIQLKKNTIASKKSTDTSSSSATTSTTTHDDISLDWNDLYSKWDYFSFDFREDFVFPVSGGLVGSKTGMKWSPHLTNEACKNLLEQFKVVNKSKKIIIDKLTATANNNTKKPFPLDFIQSEFNAWCKVIKDKDVFTLLRFIKFLKKNISSTLQRQGQIHLMTFSQTVMKEIFDQMHRFIAYLFLNTVVEKITKNENLITGRKNAIDYIQDFYNKLTTRWDDPKPIAREAIQILNSFSIIEQLIKNHDPVIPIIRKMLDCVATEKVFALSEADLSHYSFYSLWDIAGVKDGEITAYLNQWKLSAVGQELIKNLIKIGQMKGKENNWEAKKAEAKKFFDDYKKIYLSELSFFELSITLEVIEKLARHPYFDHHCEETHPLDHSLRYLCMGTKLTDPPVELDDWKSYRPGDRYIHITCFLQELMVKKQEEEKKNIPIAEGYVVSLINVHDRVKSILKSLIHTSLTFGQNKLDTGFEISKLFLLILKLSEENLLQLEQFISMSSNYQRKSLEKDFLIALQYLDASDLFPTKKNQTGREEILFFIGLARNMLMKDTGKQEQQNIFLSTTATSSSSSTSYYNSIANSKTKEAERSSSKDNEDTSDEDSFVIISSSTSDSENNHVPVAFKAAVNYLETFQYTIESARKKRLEKQKSENKLTGKSSSVGHFAPESKNTASQKELFKKEKKKNY